MQPIGVPLVLSVLLLPDKIRLLAPPKVLALRPETGNTTLPAAVRLRPRLVRVIVPLMFLTVRSRQESATLVTVTVKAFEPVLEF